MNNEIISNDIKDLLEVIDISDEAILASVMTEDGKVANTARSQTIRGCPGC